MNLACATTFFRGKLIRLLLIGLFVVSEAGWAARPASAAPTITIHVNTTTDTNSSDSLMSLREAILLVNGGTGGDGVRTGLNRPLSAGETALITGGTIGSSGVVANIVFTNLIATDTINVMNTTGFLNESLPPILTSGVVIDGTTGSGTPVVIQGLVASADVLWFGWVDQTPPQTNPAFISVSNETVKNVRVTTAGRYGIHLEPANNSLVSGVIVDGSTSYAIFINGKFAPAMNNIVENSTVGPNNSLGVVINRPGSANTIVRNNHIGVNKAGTAAAPNTGAGLALFTGTTGNQITGNVISGNTLQGVYIDGTAVPVTHNTFTNNMIGTAADGTTPIPNIQGIVLNNGSSSNTFGGTGANQANTIAYNTQSGIVIVGVLSFGNRISGNSIFQNSILGIDLLDDKLPTLGISGGGAGPNELSLVPTLTTAQVSGNLAVINGTASPNATVEIFAADPSPSGYGEGKTFCASVTANGSGAFSFRGFMSCTPGSAALTATSTLTDGSTSEFGHILATTSTPHNFLPFVNHP